MRPPRLRTLLIPIAVVTALTTVPPAAGSGPGSHSGSFTALSYNVAGLPQGVSGSDPATNSKLISPLLNAYDLVLLQENWADPLHDAREAGLAEGVPPIMFHHEVVGEADHPYRSEPARHPYGAEVRRPGTGPTLISDGLNRLSRFGFEQPAMGEELPLNGEGQPLDGQGSPVTRVMWEACHGEFQLAVVQAVLGATPLGGVFDDHAPDEVKDALEDGAADCGSQKGFSVARTMLAPGVTVDVYNLHADAGGHPRDQAARDDNFAQLASFIIEHSEGHAVILGGDTNLKIDRPDRSRDAEVWSRFLSETALVDVCAAIECGADDAVIDKFAFRSVEGLKLIPQSHSFERETFTRDDGEPLSDHDPLAVKFHWVVTGKAA